MLVPVVPAMLELDQLRDPLQVVTAYPRLLGQLDLAQVAAHALLEIDTFALDRPGRAGVFAHSAHRALSHALDAEGRKQRGQR